MTHTLSKAQRSYCRTQLAVLHGILAEITAKHRELRNRIRLHPDQLDQINALCGKLENELDLVMFNLEFIENWPGDPTNVVVVAKNHKLQIAASEPEMIDVTTVDLDTKDVETDGVGSMATIPPAALALLP